MNTLFPIFVKAEEIQILIVGGGEVAEEKLNFLLKSSPNALVTLVAIKVANSIFEYQVKHPQLIIEQRPFYTSDVEGKKMVIVAANNPLLNSELRLLSKRKTFLLNAADKPQYCDFYLGGIVTKGDLKMGISTNGKAPIMAKRLRQFFEKNLPENLPQTLNELETLRKSLTGDFEQKLNELNKLTKQLTEQ